jgi:hypothetical protein
MPALRFQALDQVTEEAMCPLERVLVGTVNLPDPGLQLMTQSD